MRYTDAIKREGESIGRWCRRYVGISRRDERRSQFCFHQCVGQRSNLLAQLFEKVVNKRVGRPTTGIDLSSTSGRVTSWNCGTSSNVPLFSQSRLRATGADIVFVPYKGAAPAITDVLGGQIQIHVSAKSVLLPLIKSEKLRALAVTSTQRWPELPAVPTMCVGLRAISACLSRYFALAVRANWGSILKPPRSSAAIRSAWRPMAQLS
jgi:hypothetical protein